MGLFSSKKKTYVNMSVTRMLDDGDITPIGKAAIIDYVLSENKRVDALADSYVDMLNKHNQESIGNKVLSLNSWAKKKYHYGALVSSTYSEGDINLPEELKAYLSTVEGEAVTVDYAKFGPLNNQHFAYKQLIDHFGFDIRSNEVVNESVRNGFTTYLEDMVIYYCSKTIEDVINPDYLNPLGYPSKSGKTVTRVVNRKVAHTPWEEDINASEDYAIAKLVYRNGSQDVIYTIRLDFMAYEISGEQNLPEAGVETKEDDPDITQEMSSGEPDYFMVRYRLADGEEKLFTYLFGSETVNAIESLFRKDVDLGIHIPNVYLRLNGRDLHEAENEAAKSSKVYCNKLGFDYATVSKQIMDQVDNKKDIKDMFISFRLSPNDTKDPIVSEYFYYFFEEMYKTTGAKRKSSDDRKSHMKYIEGQALGAMSYSVEDNVSQVNCNFTAMGYEDVVGSIGPVGTFKSEFSNVEYSGFAGRLMNKLFRPRHMFRKQVTETVYREYYVDGLSIDQKLSSGHWTSASKEDENLCLPVDIELIAKRMRKHRHWLISKSFLLVVTTVKVVKQKWYQTGIFKVIMFIIAVVVSFFTGGQGLVWYLALAKAIAVAVVVQAAVMAISAILTALGIDASIVAAIVAVIALVAGAYAVLSDTTVAGLNATQLMSVTNVSFAVSHNHIALNTKRAIQAFEEFKDLMESEMDSIEEQRKLLGLEDGGKIDVYTLLARQTREPDIRLGETPVNFYERTLMVNAGLATTALLNNYVLISLQLPSFESFMAKRSNYNVW